MLRGKARVQGKGRPFLEFVTGSDLYRVLREWRQLVRVVDHRRNRYTERITDATGKVVRDVNEPLSEHINRGAAKPQPPKQPEA
ncbi:MAG TPA: hypothetical protein VG276_11390 [Actinomycetes bacterium]|jgi:hypothetical protein|nr:hypothetical protein [Actinomycetes bacterium]